LEFRQPLTVCNDLDRARAGRRGGGVTKLTGWLANWKIFASTRAHKMRELATGPVIRNRRPREILIAVETQAKAKQTCYMYLDRSDVSSR
jgi:hypothetical protein